MRTLIPIFFAILLGASRLAGAQTLEDASKAVDKKEYDKARDILEKLTTSGDLQAEIRLADMYVRGAGIPRNTTRGLALYESASNKGNAEAKYFLGTELMKGGLMRADKKRAVGLLRTASKLKHGGAQYALCEEQSTEGSKFFDLVEAYAWCEASSKKDHRQARDAGRRAKDMLQRIGDKQGAQFARDAQVRANIYSRDY